MGFHNSILFIILSITFLFQSLLHHPVFALRDRLQPGDEVDSFDPSTYLVSSNGMFTLGFFTIPSTNLTYLAIWFTNEQHDMKIWVANPDTPVIGRGLFTGLRVINGSGAVFFSTDLVGLRENVVAYLQDVGNLYVAVKGVKYWESFYNPTDTLLSSTDLGYEYYFQSFNSWMLTSWLSDEVPASGAFTLTFEVYRNSPQLLIYRRENLYWASGPWDSTARTFQFLRFVNGSRFIFPARTSASSFILKLYPNGKFVDVKNQLSLTPEFCYGYENDNGCVVSPLPNCRGKSDTFQLTSGDWIGGPSIKDDNSSISHADCTERCWNDCTCAGFKTMNSNGTGCIFWTADSTFVVDESGRSGTNYVLLTPKPNPPSPSPQSPPPPPKIRDTLYPGDAVYSFNQSTNVVSFYGAFTLGFFTIPSTNLTYLGLWLTSEPRDMIIWVANRDTPIDGQGLFTARILYTPVLHVVNVGKIALDLNLMHVRLSYNITAVLDNWGCLYVYETLWQKTEHPFKRLWQSTDHPTDTLLSFSKLGYDFQTNQSRTITSWLSDDVPALGAFTLTFEQYQNSPQLLIYRRGKLYWASGPWNSTARTFQFLSYVNGSRFIFPQHVNLASDASGMRFSFVSDDDLLMFKLSPNGQIRLWNAKLTPEFCYGYESDNGCVVSELPSCRGKKDSFQLTSGDWIGSPSIKDDNSSISHADCIERCWNDCTCAGFKTMNSNGTGCIFWTANATFIADESDQTGKKYVLVSAPPLPPKKKAWVWILVSLAIVLLCVLAYVGIKRHIINVKENKRRDDFILQMTGSNSFNYGDELERSIKDAPDVRIFNLKAIMAATNNFSNENKLGQGGYGPVYRGELSDGRQIAIKRLSKTSGQGILEFKSELILISKLQHTNLVRLYGCCIHRQEKMLIYEFMPNKSLDFFLFAQDEKKKLGWQIRVNIIEGVAQGLLYLHKYSRMKVIHRDLKVGNVLLDDNMNPKIADFGMARIFQQNVTEAVTNRVVGTYGYMAPEYAMEGTFSIKSDVFSFGVLILEIVSGRRNSSFYNPDRPLNLVGYAWELWIGHASLELKDETLGESYDVKQLLRVIHLGLLCVQEKADDRPTMSDVIYILNNENIILPSPKQPPFFTGRQTAGFRLSETIRSVQVSENSLTVTTMEAR